MIEAIGVGMMIGGAVLFLTLIIFVTWKIGR